MPFKILSLFFKLCSSLRHMGINPIHHPLRFVYHNHVTPFKKNSPSRVSSLHNDSMLGNILTHFLCPLQCNHILPQCAKQNCMQYSRPLDLLNLALWTHMQTYRNTQMQTYRNTHIGIHSTQSHPFGPCGTWWRTKCYLALDRLEIIYICCLIDQTASTVTGYQILLVRKLSPFPFHSSHQQIYIYSLSLLGSFLKWNRSSLNLLFSSLDFKIPQLNFH